MYGCSTADPRPFRTARLRFIRFDGERAIVSGEIHIGDPIIAVGGHFLHEGQHVK